MSYVQKIIKYCALVFAFMLVLGIFSTIMGITGSIGNIFGSGEISDKLEKIDLNSDVAILKIETKSTNIIIKTGELLKAETNNKDINVKQDSNKLLITEKGVNWFKNRSDLIIYIPENLVFDDILMDAGAGKVTIDKLSTKELYLDLGVGKVDISNLTVYNEADIDGGAGEITISGTINNLDLDMGVGKLTLNSKITGNSQIDSGIGEMDLNLIGSFDSYKIRLDKGIGSATIDGNNMSSDTYYGTGANFIDIDGGIGSIKIDFAD